MICHGSLKNWIAKVSDLWNLQNSLKQFCVKMAKLAYLKALTKSITG
jgi:hypothetical protein